MRKQELVKEVAYVTDVSEATVTKVLNALLNTIQNSLARRDEVTISGFGSFKVAERAGREGRNPRTGEQMMIAARRSPTFKAGQQLKRAVEETYDWRNMGGVPIDAVRWQDGSGCPPEFPVKGNADSGLYHVPGTSSYNQTIPEFCFASAAAAEAAGFDAPKH